MSDWKNALRNVAEMTNDYIRRDDFPDGIEPDLLRDAVRAYPMMGGKRLRPALVMWSCGLFGGDPAMALPAAASVEIYHNWTLVHDDIIDCDDMRRNQPATHADLAAKARTRYSLKQETAAKFGTDFAILAGDLQQAWSANCMLKTDRDPRLLVFLLRKMQEELGRDLISGEALDVAFEVRNDTITEAEVRTMIEGKTGALFRFCVKTGAVIATNTPGFDTPEIQKIATYAGELAMAFQLRDDWLGIFGELEKFGKPLCSDFQEGKPTLLYLAAYKNASPEEKEQLTSLLHRESYPPETVEEIRTLLRKTGAEDAILDEIRTRSRNAAECLQGFPASVYRELLAGLAEGLTVRTV